MKNYCRAERDTNRVLSQVRAVFNGTCEKNGQVAGGVEQQGSVAELNTESQSVEN